MASRRVGANRRNSKRRRRGAASARVKRQGPRLIRASVVLLILGLAVTGVVVGVRRALSWVRASERFSVATIRVSGACSVDSTTIVARAGLEPGMSLLDVKPSEIRKALRVEPCIERVKVARWFPGRVSLRITERRPVALVNLGEIYQVDESGVLFDVQPGTYLTLPVFSGLRDTVTADGLRRLAPESLRRLASFRRAEAVSDGDWFAHLSQVDFTSEGIVRITLDGYPAVIEMDAADVTGRLNQLRRLLEVLAEERGGDDVERINLCHASMAYVRR